MTTMALLLLLLLLAQKLDFPSVNVLWQQPFSSYSRSRIAQHDDALSEVGTLAAASALDRRGEDRSDVE